MTAPGRAFIPWLLLLGPVLGRGLWLADHADSIAGWVSDANGPIAGAHIRWQGDANFSVSDQAGRFVLSAPSIPGRPLTVCKTGYQILATADLRSPMRLRLSAWPEDDLENAVWIEPHADRAKPMQCANCHAEIYREWLGSAHARSAINPKFLSFYDEPASSWNVRTEHPLGAGVCASCHVPTLSSPTLEYDPRAAQGASRAGVHCDFCHKVVEAPVDRLGTRFGRDGLRLLRSASPQAFFLGPLEDAVRPGESFAALPLYRESRYCASCHEGIVFGNHAYSTYSEWLASPAARAGRQCQDCHMTPVGTLTNLASGHGGIPRAPATLASHALPGNQREHLQRCLKMKIDTQLQPNGTEITIELRAEEVGHRVPTGFIDRHLILVVVAKDAQGQALPVREGSRLSASVGSWSGQAGWLFARRLESEAGESPIPFWKPSVRTIDTRLKPEAPERHRYLFAAEARSFEVQLIYRRFWDTVARQRGWSDHEMVVISRQIPVSPP